MFAIRWLRAAARGTISALAVVPTLALLLAVVLDRGADGSSRDPRFPVALFASNPFAWTCLTNSVLFAGLLTGLALVGGVALGSLLARTRDRAGWLAHAAVASLLAAPPVAMALGFQGIAGYRWLPDWQWTGAFRDAAWGNPSLETWRSWPSWLLWLGTSLPAGVALVALRSASALGGVRREWIDAARLAGAGPVRIRLFLTWPLIRPHVARASALIFPLALLEPGAPLVLGLRRTLAFQIVQAAGRSDPFPSLAVWTLAAAAIALAGRAVLRWWGGDSRLRRPEGQPARATGPGSNVSLAIAALVVAIAAVSWLPAVGLIAPLLDAGSMSGQSSGAGTGLAGRVLGPPMGRLLGNSAVLGLAVGAVVVLFARLLRPGPGARLAPTFGARLAGRLALSPPLVQGVGILAVPGVLTTLAALTTTRWPASNPTWQRLAGLLAELAVDRDPRPLLVAAVGVSVGLRLIAGWRRHGEAQPDETRSGLEAAVVAGASLGLARGVAAAKPARWVGAFLLAALLAAGNLAPALLFEPLSNDQTIGPAILALAGGRAGAGRLAATLALLLVATRLAALAVSRLATTPPPEWDDDPTA